MRIGYLTGARLRAMLGVDDIAAEIARVDFNKANASTVGGISTAINALQNSVAGKASAADLSAVAASVPQPANVAPPAVAIDSAMGSGAGFARGDHTHESRLQARRVQVTPDANGRWVYVFPKPYPTGYVPIVNVTAETPAAATYRNDAGLVEGTTSNTQVTIQITRVQRTVTLPSVLTSLLGLVVNLFAPVTTPVWVNIMSRAPS